MGKPVTAADANRNFSKLLRDVRDGQSYVITSHGKPVAQLIPIVADDTVRAAAKRALIARLRGQTSTPPIGKWTRDALYEG